MSMYRKKPVIIEARQFDGSQSSGSDLMEWINSESSGPLVPPEFPNDTPRYPAGLRREEWIDPWTLTIITLEGTMKASAGDYIIRGVQGEFYPCKPDIFEQTYEPLEEEAPQ